METTSDTLQPRDQLNMLPDELKTYIARLCAEQDDAIREAFTDISQRFAAMYPLRSEVYEYKRKFRGSIGALYGASKGWQAVAAPYRFRHLSWKQLSSERFRYDYAARFGRFFVSLDLTPGTSIVGYLHLAGAVLLLPNLVQIKVGNYEQVFESARDPERHTRSHSKYAIDSAEAAVVRLLNTVVDVSMTDTDLDQTSERLSYSACKRLKRLSIQITTTSFGQLIPFLMTMRNLESLELSLSGDADATEANLSELLDDYEMECEDEPEYASSLPKLRSLKLEYPDISRAVLGLAELFAPTLKSLDLHLTAYSDDFQPARPDEPTGFDKVFPVLRDLSLSGNIDALRGPLASISDNLFPSIKHLRYLPDVLRAHCPRRQGEPMISQTIPQNTIDRISAYNRIGPVYQLKPSPYWRMDSFVTAPPLYPRLLTHVAEPGSSDTPSRLRDLRTTLDLLREWEVRAEIQGDTASLLRMASALTRVELERIAHEA